MTKRYVCCAPNLSKHTLFDRVFCCTSLRWWHLRMRFSFFQNLVFWVVREAEMAKMAQNDKWNLSHSVSQELYLIWLWCLVHMCKMMIFNNITYSSFFFSFFQNSDFSGFSKFINKCQKEILRCAPPCSYVCDICNTKNAILIFI